MRNLLTELGYPVEGMPSVPHIDNNSAISVARNPEHLGRLKHLDLRSYWLRDIVQAGLIDPQFCPTAQMPADMLTKALPRPKVVEMRILLGLQDLGQDLPHQEGVLEDDGVMSSQTFLSPISLPFHLSSCVTSKPHSHTTLHPLTSSSYLLLLSFYSVFLIAGLCPGLFLGVSALIKRPSARISLQPEPTCIFQLLNSDCRQVVTFSLYLVNCSTQTAVCLYL